MSKLKTVVNKASPLKFINKIENRTKKEDSLVLLDLFESVTGEKAKMWGDSIIGFGSYHYKSERSTQEGDWPLTGFSPRKQYLSIYIMPGFSEYKSLLKKIGKHKHSVSCLYVNNLKDIDIKVLEKLIKRSINDMKKIYNVK